MRPRLQCCVLAGLALLFAGPASAQRPASPAQQAPTGLPRTTAIIPGLGGPLVVTLVLRDSAVQVHDYVERAKQDVYVLDSTVASTDSLADAVRINGAAGQVPVRVSPQTIRLIHIAGKAWRISGHRLDPTSPPLEDQLERRERIGVIPSPAERDSARALVDFRAVRVNAAARTVFLPRAGMRIDLALVARGRNLDVARAAFAARSIVGGVVQVGSSALAWGRPATGDRWEIALVPPRTGRQIIGVAAIDSGAVFVVADSVRSKFPVRDPIRLVNAKTGERATGIGSVTVIAPTAAYANAAAAALYMLTPERALAVADSLHLAAMIIRPARPGKPIAAGDVMLSAQAERFVRLIPELQPTGERGADGPPSRVRIPLH